MKIVSLNISLSSLNVLICLAPLARRVNTEEFKQKFHKISHMSKQPLKKMCSLNSGSSASKLKHP
jgi:hypothetical protein